jgi:hypothetical protein
VEHGDRREYADLVKLNRSYAKLWRKRKKRSERVNAGLLLEILRQSRHCEKAVPLEPQEDTRDGIQRSRGPRPDKREATTAKMKQEIAKGGLTLEKLNAMREKELAAKYGVSRDTARRARHALNGA